MTIYDIKEESNEKAPYFFSRNTLRFFNQTLKDFSVIKQKDGKYLISAPMTDRNTGENVGYTKRMFNPITKELELIT